MKVPSPHYLTARLIGAFMLGAGVLLCPDAPFAAEGLALPPAPYEGLPVGTEAYYAAADYLVTVTENEGFEFAYKAGETTGAAPAFGAGPVEDRWRGNVRCDDRLRARFEVTLTDGQFSHIGYNLSISGEIRSGKYDIRGRYRDDEFSVSGAFAGDTINASDGGFFSTCYVNLFRISTPQEQQAMDSTAREPDVVAAKKKTEEIAALKAEYERIVKEEEAAKQRASNMVGVVTTTKTVGVQSIIPTPAEAAAAKAEAAAEIARLKQELKKSQNTKTAPEPLVAAEIARLQRKLKELQIANVARDTAGEVAARASGPDVIAGLRDVDFGRYQALVIGINRYKYLPALTTAVNDAKSVARVLTDEYGFKVKLLLNARRGDIVEVLDEYREALGPRDNLLIYYAGHGWLDEEADRGYWLPADARPKRRTNWVSNATITDTLKVLSAKHVMVVADSCFSGTLVRSANVGTRTRAGDYWKKMASKWARVAITSGGLEPVADKGGGKNSPFAKAFIDALRSNKAIMDGTELFQSLRRPVMVAADQTPEYSDVRGAGHDGGDFLFVRKN